MSSARVARPRPRLRDATRGLAVFAGVGTLYVALGRTVADRAPGALDEAAAALAGKGTHVAWIFTASCLWPALTILGVIGVAAAIRFRAWRGRIVFAIVTTLVAWQTSDVLKNVFRRPRPPHWYLYHEPSFAYSSGHAMFATLVYGLWAYHAARSDAPRPVRLGLAFILAAWGLAVIWSRLALGAHFPTDLIGGVLIGIAMLALADAVAAIIAPAARVL